MLELIDGGCGQVHKRLTASASKGGDLLYETELLEQFADTDAAKDFFECLDMQLNKVNQFYKTKEKEFLERGECLKKQMQILSELKTIIKQQQHRKGEEEDASISCSISCGIISIYFMFQQTFCVNNRTTFSFPSIFHPRPQS